MGLPFQPGDVLAGKYVVERFVGQGGAGVVLAARHILLKQRVAVKLLHDHVATIPEVAARFLREAQATAKLTSPHTARVMDADRLETGRPFIVMEYLEGRDLRTVVKDDGPLTPAMAARYLAQAASALAEAHSLGIVHRDVKPSNLFLASDRSGKSIVKVLDFGISKVLPFAGDAGGLESITRSGQVLGSLHFMSPEQMRSAHNVDQRTDIWSLGVTLFALSTGRYPFTGKGLVDLLNEILHGPRPTLGPGAPPALEAIVARCLRVDPSGRYPSAAELALELAQFAGDNPAAPPIRRPEGSTSLPAAAAPVALDRVTNAAPGRPKAMLRPIVAAGLAITALAGLGAWGASRRQLRESKSIPSAQASVAASPSIAPAVSPSASTPALPTESPSGFTTSEPAGAVAPVEVKSAHAASNGPHPPRALGHPAQAGRAAPSPRAAPSTTASLVPAATPSRRDIEVIHDLPH